MLESIAQFLTRQGLEVSVDRDTALATDWNDFGALTPAEIGQQCDMAVVVGGDGTMLGIARELSRYNMPLVGINQGRLGFITDVRAADWEEALGPIVRGDYEEERRSMIEGGIWRDDTCIYEGQALNDVVVGRGITPSMVELRVDVGGEFVANMRADGLILASPTGSTAYSLSAGGPILHPSIGGWVLVPIASHTLSNRPIVLPDSQEVVITIVNGGDISANFDMHGLASLMLGDQIRLRRSAQAVRFLHPRGWSYYATLRRKLRWYEGVV
jgi:NAD+ kinase